MQTLGTRVDVIFRKQRDFNRSPICERIENSKTSNLDQHFIREQIGMQTFDCSNQPSPLFCFSFMFLIARIYSFRREYMVFWFILRGKMLWNVCIACDKPKSFEKGWLVSRPFKMSIFLAKLMTELLFVRFCRFRKQYTEMSLWAYWRILVFYSIVFNQSMFYIYTLSPSG